MLCFFLQKKKIHVLNQQLPPLPMGSTSGRFTLAAPTQVSAKTMVQTAASLCIHLGWTGCERQCISAVDLRHAVKNKDTSEVTGSKN